MGGSGWSGTTQIGVSALIWWPLALKATAATLKVTRHVTEDGAER